MSEIRITVDEQGNVILDAERIVTEYDACAITRELTLLLGGPIVIDRKRPQAAVRREVRRGH